jgi:hypothetical protein
VSWQETSVYPLNDLQMAANLESSQGAETKVELVKVSFQASKLSSTYCLKEN